ARADVAPFVATGLPIRIGDEFAHNVTTTQNITEAYTLAWYTFTVTEVPGLAAGATLTPATIIGDGVSTTNLRVTVTNASGLPNAAVSADFSAVGGASSVQLFDDGNHNDGNAGDGIFGVDFAPPGDHAAGTFAIPFHVTATGGSFDGSVDLTLVSRPTPVAD